MSSATLQLLLHCASAAALGVGAACLFFLWRRRHLFPASLADLLLGLRVHGPVPHPDSLQVVVQWVFHCFARRYPEAALRLLFRRLQVHFAYLPEPGALLYAEDARETELASYLSRRIVEHFEPKLDRPAVRHAIATAWLAYPQDYRTAHPSRLAAKL